MRNLTTITITPSTSGVTPRVLHVHGTFWMHIALLKIAFAVVRVYGYNVHSVKDAKDGDVLHIFNSAKDMVHLMSIAVEDTPSSDNMAMAV